MALTKVIGSGIGTVTNQFAAGNMSAESVIQTKSASVTAAASITSNQTNTYVDIGLSLAITPTSSSSKILVMVNASLGTSLGTAHFRLIRGSTAVLIGDAASDRLRDSVAYRDAATPYNLNMHEFSITFLDSPATTSATTYKLQGTLGSTYNGIIYLNRTHADPDADYGARPASTISLQEISA